MPAAGGLHGNLWPNAAQTALLKAAIDADGRAPQHYADWRGQVDLAAEFDRGSYRLLPLLYRTLSRHGVQDDFSGRLKGTYRRIWCETQTRLDAAARVLTLLQAAGIPTVVLKGLALGVGWYGNPVLRPMGDLDVLVPHAQAAAAIAAVEAAGWRRTADSRDDDLVYHHAMEFHHPDGAELDLHWQPMTDCRGAGASAWFAGHTLPLQVRGVATHGFDATAQLLHTVVHGLRWDVEPPIRWIADAAWLLRDPARPVDWEELLAFAYRRRLSHRLGLGLQVLATEYGLPVPAAVLARLAASRPSLLERIENSVVLRDADRLYADPLLKIWVIFARWCRIHETHTPWAFAVGFSHFLRVRWQLAGRRQLPVAILGGVLRRLRRRGRVTADSP